MSGDVQPRKRKDKRRRKDELSVEEPRGTAAVFGEGDVFMHSQHEHSTGGHWCAKVIFFSLLAVLVTLVGLIILENRGLSELEANAVESRYSGVLEGWIEDTTDDHHDEHTLELKHHDEEDDEHGDITEEEHDDNDNEEENEQTDEPDEDDDETDEGDDDIDDEDEDETHYDHEDDESDEENDSQEDADDKEDDQDNEAGDDQNINSAENEEDEDESHFRKYYENIEGNDDEVDEDHDNEDGDDDDDYRDLKDDEIDEIDDDEQKDDSNENEENYESYDEDDDQTNNDNDSDQQLDNDDDEDERDDESNEYEEPYTTRQIEEGDENDLEEDVGVEVEKIEKEVSDEDVLEEAAASNVEDEDKSADQSYEESVEENQIVDEEEFLDQEDIEEPIVVERITAPAGKPLPEVEEISSEKPPDTLAEEEEYEKQQEELRRQKEQASHLWLKVAVGGALLVATHAVVRRATAPRDPSLSAEHASREETPSAIDRRMTLIPEESSIDEPEEVPLPPPPIVKGVEKISTITAKSVPYTPKKSEEEEDQELEFDAKNVETTEFENNDEDKELYSDDDLEEEEEQEIEEQNEVPIQNLPESLEKNKDPKTVVETIKPQVKPDEEVPEDVEIIDDEQLEEEVVEEEEEDEEDISDVDDAELLSRLEAKYGRLPEPERPMPKKDGGNSVEDEWPGEPSDQYWRQQLDEAERELLQGSWVSAEQRAGAVELRGSARARYVRARALDAAAEARRDNRLLSQSIAAYLELLKMNERLSDKKLLEITNRTLDRIRFRGNYMNAEPIYRLLIRRFPDDPSLRNNLSIAFLMANKPDLAEAVLKETLRRWPDDRVALAHLGFILKTFHNKLEEAVDAIRKALEGDIGAANEPRFYFHLGDALLLLGRFEEAKEVHERGAKLGHFMSPAQRSLYNVERLKSRPWWDVEQTPYKQLARALESSWQTILKEGEEARALYEQEKEGLKERGEWSQLDLFVRGQELPGRCKKAPITCSIVRQEIAAVGCKRGQIKFSAMEAGTHVRPHVGPTNCRLRMHLGLSNTKDTYIRVDKEIRQWQVGKVLMFDDSFEHEVWHNGTGTRLVLIVDVWHPELTPADRRLLPAI